MQINDRVGESLCERMVREGLMEEFDAWRNDSLRALCVIPTQVQRNAREEMIRGYYHEDREPGDG